jgi:hypothetical protein
MKSLNTLPIENFLDRAKVAIKTNQKTINIDIKDVQSLYDSLAVVMTRLAGNLDEKNQNFQNQPNVVSINMDGGGFR